MFLTNDVAVAINGTQRQGRPEYSSNQVWESSPCVKRQLSESLREICRRVGRRGGKPASPAAVPVTRSRERPGVILPLVFRRVILREPPPCEPADIEMRVVAPE